MKAPFAAMLALWLAGCGGDRPPLSVSDVSILAPIPGRDRTVAYLTLDNRSDLPVTLNRITSPQFATVEMHATVLDDGMAAMQALDSITIAAKSRIEFTAGGRHVMLIAPRDALQAGDTVTLEFHFDRPGLLTLDAPLRSRIPDGGD